MFRSMTAVGLAMGLLLPGSVILAETAQEQKENQVRTENQQMVQAGPQAAGEQEQMMTREGRQTHDHSGEMKKQQQKRGSGAGAAGDRIRDNDHDRDQLRDHDRLRDHTGSGSQNRGGGR